MENTNFIDNLDQAVSQVFEMSYFMDLYIDPSYEPYNGPVSVVKLPFAIESTGGELSFYFCEKLGKNITANFLGIEKDEADNASIHDMLKETSNMVGGVFLSPLKETYEHDLGLPGEVSLLSKFAASDTCKAYMHNEEGFFAINLELRY
jgi:hypothetical protein